MLNLMMVESKRQWIIFARYPIEAFAGVIVFTIIFFGLVTGSTFLAGPAANFGQRLDIVVAGYVLWLVTTGLFAGPGAQLLDDARSGILEQLFLSQHNFAVFTALRVFSGLIQHFTLIAVVLITICLLTGVRLQYRLDEVLPFLGVILASTGLGLVVAAYALLVKQVQALLGVGQFFLLALVMTPLATMGSWGPALAAITPINPSAQLLQTELATGHIGSYGEVAIALGNGLAYFFLGLILLDIASLVARRRGSIGSF